MARISFVCAHVCVHAYNLQVDSFAFQILAIVIICGINMLYTLESSVKIFNIKKSKYKHLEI